jgi:hypothetical protein
MNKTERANRRCLHAVVRPLVVDGFEFDNPKRPTQNVQPMLAPAGWLGD